MLTQITIRNLAIVQELELEFYSGMHVITGETGAGKSIIIDALGIVLGDRVTASQIRQQQTQAEITACFDIKNLPIVQKLLADQELAADECIIRRIINSDGRTRAYINGQSVALQQIKNLAPFLVHIHSQHQHHALLDSAYQRQLLDEYANHSQLVQEVQEIYNEWLSIKHKIQELTAAQQQADKLSLLNYQIQELESLQLQHNELQTLDQKHAMLAKGQEILNVCQNVCGLLSEESESDEPAIAKQLHYANQQISALIKIVPGFKNISEMLQQAIIVIDECSSNLQDYSAQIDMDPQELMKIESRLTSIHALARKLKVPPDLLIDHLKELKVEQQKLSSITKSLEELHNQLLKVYDKYQIKALQLSNSRKTAAEKLTAEVSNQLKLLEMPNAVFSITSEKAKTNDPTPNGYETIHFLIAANPGQPLGLLKKIASGGELSRISLAIQAITATQMATPTIILDEVDVGISGKTAATVGALIKSLGANAQILCITHLPQVAAYGHKHIKVQKTHNLQHTSVQVIYLDKKERVQELARLVGGNTITPEAIAHAQTLIE